MTDLVACLSSGKGTWIEVKNLIEKGEWEKVFLITNDFGVKNFSTSKKVEYVLIDSLKSIEAVVLDIKSQIDNQLVGTQVALNISSGSGKEHMAVISALLKLGLGIRLVDFCEDCVKEI